MEQLCQLAEALQLTQLSPISISEPQNFMEDLLPRLATALLSAQQNIGRLNSENIKLKQQLRQAKQKQQQSKNGNNTESGFMLPSQFKQKWQVFIKQNLNVTFFPLYQDPTSYLASINKFIQNSYDQLQSQLQHLIQRQLDILQIDRKFTKELLQSQLKFLQNNWDKLPLGFRSQQFSPAVDSQQLSLCENNFRQICIYLLLQESPVWLQQGSTQPFSKKEHICIEGSAKQGQEVLVLLQAKKQAKTLYKKGVIPKVPFMSAKQSSPLIQLDLNMIKFSSAKVDLPRQSAQKPKTSAKQLVEVKPSRSQIAHINHRKNRQQKPSIFKFQQRDSSHSEQRLKARKDQNLNDRIILLKQKIQSEVKNKKPLSTLKEEILRQLIKTNHFTESLNLKQKLQKRRSQHKGVLVRSKDDQNRPLKILDKFRL